MMFTGAVGIGKQRLALWLGQLLLCTEPGTEPCGRCRACRMVLGLGHPDLHWFVPIPRPKAGEPDRQVQEAEELLSEALAARRERPFFERSDGMAFHPLSSVKLLLRRAVLTPVLGGRRIFVLGEADRLVPQESSPEAANALLKFLEEPPRDTWVLLTASESERVLPTIRSRVTAVRLSPVADSEVRAFLEQVLGRSGQATELFVRQAEGAIGTLAQAAPQEGGDRADRAVREAQALLAAIGNGATVDRFERALKQAPWAARGGFTDLLDAVAGELIERARNSGPGGGAAAMALALPQVARARDEAQGNVNPQLILADLAHELAAVL